MLSSRENSSLLHNSKPTLLQTLGTSSTDSECFFVHDTAGSELVEDVSDGARGRLPTDDSIVDGGKALTPEVLSDVFESVAGAIYLDSGYSLDAVWRVYCRLMEEPIGKSPQSISRCDKRIGAAVPGYFS